MLRHLFSGCPDSHRLGSRLLQPPWGRLAALAIGERWVLTAAAQRLALLLGQQQLTTGWAVTLTASLPASNRHTCQSMCPQPLLSPERMAGTPSSPSQHLSGLKCCPGQWGEGTPWVPRDIRTVNTLQGLLWCDTNIWTKQLKLPVWLKYKLRLWFIWANLCFKTKLITFLWVPLASFGRAWAASKPHRQGHLPWSVQVWETTGR